MAFPDTDLDVIVEAYLGADPTADPETWGAPTDLSSRLLRKPIQIRRGRGNNQKTAQAGSCTLWLDNTDGALTPLLATSTYYPDWDLGVPLRVLVDNVGEFPPYVRHAGFVADITAVMVPGVGGVNISAVRVTSAGVLRRLSQGEVFKSPLRRAYLSSSQPELVAYWPCEDEEGATSVASGIASNTVPLVPAGIVQPDAPHFSTGIAGSSGCLDLIATGEGLGTSGWITLPSASGFQIEISMLGDQGHLVIMLDCYTNPPSGLVRLSAVAEATDGVPHHIAYRLVQNGGNVDTTTYRDGIVTSTGSFAGTLTNTIQLLTSPYDLDTGLLATGTLLMSHIAVYGFSDMDVPTTRAPATDGYTDEMAHERVQRVCGEEGIPYSGTATISTLCGPQPIDVVTAVLRDAETTDHGMLTEDFAWGLGYRASTQRYNLDPDLIVDLSTYRTTAGTQADVLAPIRNDARLRNEWTVTRPGGSSSTASDTANIAKRGRFKDSATVNVVDDTVLFDEASWRVHEGTFDGLRYDTVPLDIAANL